MKSISALLHSAALRRRSLFAGLLLLSATVPAALGIDASRSEVRATFRQLDVPVEGRFTLASGQIVFDAAKPQLASATLLIDTASFDLGMDDYNAEVRKKEWFDSKAFPQARFVSTGFKPLGGNRYEASGRLEIKGRSQNISVPVTVTREAAAQVFSGKLPVSRKAFDIGDASWAEVVEDIVVVSFRITQPI